MNSVARPVFDSQLGTVGLWISGPHEWSVLASCSSFSYLYDIGALRYATIPSYSGIWPWFAMAFGPWHLVGHLLYMWPSPMLFAVSSISLTLAEQHRYVCLVRSYLYIHIYLVLQVCAQHGSLVAPGHEKYACSGVYLHIDIALVLLRPNHYSSWFFQPSLTEKTKGPI